MTSLFLVQDYRNCFSSRPNSDLAASLSSLGSPDISSVKMSSLQNDVVVDEDHDIFVSQSQSVPTTIEVSLWFKYFHISLFSWILFTNFKLYFYFGHFVLVSFFPTFLRSPFSLTLFTYFLFLSPSFLFSLILPISLLFFSILSLFSFLIPCICRLVS